MRKIILNLMPAYRLLYFAVSSTVINFYMWGLKFKLRSLGKNCQVYFANITEPFNVSLGHHVYINKQCDIITTSAKVDIGNFVMIGPNVTFIAQDHDISDWEKPMIFSNKYKRGDIVIEDDVWIGANVTILSGVKIHRGAVVGAGAVVTKDVDYYTIVGGIPASKINRRLSKTLINKALKQNFLTYKNKQINWRKWGVGQIA